MRTMFSIGETAKIHHISKQSLIFYDKIDLLKPARVDPHNGYRYYSLEEFAVLDIILFLKNLGVPLEDIKTYIQERNIVKSIEFFEHRLRETQEKIKSLKAVKQKIENALSVYEDYKEWYNYKEPFIKVRKAQHALFAPVAPPYDIPQVDISMKKLLYFVEQEEYLADYTIGTTVTMPDLAAHSFVRNQKTFIIINKSLRLSSYRKIPAGRYATIYHHGSYESIDRAYLQLLQYIRAQNFRICSEAYEYLLFDIFVVKDKKDFVTEISIQIE